MNNLDFTQAYVSPALVDFEKDFRDKWNLATYTDPNSPAVFFGMYNQSDAMRFSAHVGPKIIVWGGNDMHAGQLGLVKGQVDSGKAFTFAPPGEFDRTLTEAGIAHKVCYIPNKDYSRFEPTPLGENIYMYLGRPDNPRYDYFKYDEIVRPLIHVFGEDRVKWVIKDERQTLPMDELVSKYYEDCFVFVKPNDRGGVTTMYDLAHMGRRTIGKGESDLPNFTEYTDIDNLIALIVEESKYIGQARPDVSDALKSHFHGDEWLTLDFWT